MANGGRNGLLPDMYMNVIGFLHANNQTTFRRFLMISNTLKIEKEIKDTLCLTA